MRQQIVRVPSVFQELDSRGPLAGLVMDMHHAAFHGHFLIAVWTGCEIASIAVFQIAQCAASFLVEKGERVSVVNPARIQYFGMGEGILNKTDKVDARVIAL